MRLGEIPAPGRKRKRRVGRGIGSGRGKTCGRGSKGQGARAGSGVKAWFEGGQMPLARRLPKRGFNNKNWKRKVAVVGLGQLNVFPAGTEVTPELLEREGLVKGRYEAVKLLATGEVDRALTVKVHAASAAAEEKVKAAGGALSRLPAAGA
ncbi:50S ribosomal protein L15 [bacterium]|nr:50S ribosomal protein L15 [bacterium]